MLTGMCIKKEINDVETGKYFCICVCISINKGCEISNQLIRLIWK